MSDTSTPTLICPKCQGATRSYERNGITAVRLIGASR